MSKCWSLFRRTTTWKFPSSVPPLFMPKWWNASTQIRAGGQALPNCTQNSRQLQFSNRSPNSVHSLFRNGANLAKHRHCTCSSTVPVLSTRAAPVVASTALGLAWECCRMDWATITQAGGWEAAVRLVLAMFLPRLQMRTVRFWPAIWAIREMAKDSWQSWPCWPMGAPQLCTARQLVGEIERIHFLYTSTFQHKTQWKRPKRA